jgi:flavin-dependent dehydrogenase
MVKDTDVFIVGGGPAGLAAAIAARQRGFSVVVADGMCPPIDKPCGEGLMPDGQAALEKLGITIPAADSHRFRGICFVSEGLKVSANFPQGTGLGIRRTALHRIMIERAYAVGVSLLWKSPVSGIVPEGVLLGGRLIRSRWIVGADGGHSLVRKWSDLDAYTSNRSRFAFRRHYRLAPWNDCMELHWGLGCQLYITPVADDEVCVALISHDPRLRLDQALVAFPDVAARLRGAETTSAERGAISMTRKLQSVYRKNVALIGDASGAVDAITGEGLCLAFKQAEALADSFSRNDLEPYQLAHHKLARRPALMAQLMLALDWNSSLRRQVIRAFNADARLFSRMLAMHVGAVSPAKLVSQGIMLGWRALAA